MSRPDFNIIGCRESKLGAHGLDWLWIKIGANFRFLYYGLLSVTCEGKSASSSAIIPEQKKDPRSLSGFSFLRG